MIDMAKGKFSQPRSPRREDRELDLAFQELSGQPVDPTPRATPVAAPNPSIEKNKKISSWPLGYHLIRTLQALLPLRALDLLCKVLGIYNALDHFKGRK